MLNKASESRLVIMICENCKQCWNYMVSEVGCYGNIKTCEYFKTEIEDDEYLIIGVDDGWIKVNNETWQKYLEAKKRLAGVIGNEV